MASSPYRPRWFVPAFVLVAGVAFAAAGCGLPYRRVTPSMLPAERPARPAADRIAAHLQALADPAHGGRMPATPGARRARTYIVREFARIGLTPGGHDDTWFQPFLIPSLRAAGEKSSLNIDGRDGALTLGKDYWPMALGCNGEFKGAVVFPDFEANVDRRREREMFQEDPEDSLDVKGRVVFVSMDPDDPDSIDGILRELPWMRDHMIRMRLKRAAKAGAVATLVATTQDGPVDSVRGLGKGQLPAMRISSELAAELKNAADTGDPPTVSGRSDLREAMGQNVIGVLMARDPKAPYIVIGAHYDHLDSSGHHAKDRGFGVRPGADDNASGVAALIETARLVADMPDRTCGFIFIAFDGEEEGMLGSKHYVEYPVVPLHRTAVMINLDQVGRLADRGLRVVGNVVRKPMSDALALAESARRGLKVRRVPIVRRRGWSDHTPFARKTVPSMHLFTGLHKQYHRKTDTPDLVDTDGVATIAAFAADLIAIFDAAYAPDAPKPAEEQPAVIVGQPH